MQAPTVVTEDSECLDQVAMKSPGDWGTANKLSAITRRAVKAWLNEDRAERGLEPSGNVSGSRHCCSFTLQEIVISPLCTAGQEAATLVSVKITA